MATTLDVLIAEAVLGEEARNFAAGELGKCIVGMAKQEAEGARQELATVDATDAKKISELQTKVWRGEHFEEWLCELITRGNQALEVYKHEQANG